MCKRNSVDNIRDIDQRLVVKPRPSLLGDGDEYVIR